MTKYFNRNSTGGVLEITENIEISDIDVVLEYMCMCFREHDEILIFQTSISLERLQPAG